MAVIVAASPLAAQSQANIGRPSLLTLADAVAQALIQNSRLLDARDTVEQADLALRLARSEFKPRVTPNIFGSFGRTDVSNQTYGLEVSQRFTGGTAIQAVLDTATERNQLGNYYTNNTTFSLSQSLLRGFGPTVGRRNVASAERRAVDALRERALTEQQIALDVAAAYYAIVAQQQLAQIAEKAAERSRRLLEASIAKLRIGRVSQLDVFRAQQLVAQSDGQLLDSRVATEDAKDRLRDILRRGSDFEFTVTAEIPQVSYRIGPDAAVDLALQNRLELQSAEGALAEADRTIRFSRNQLLPQFDINLALTRRETADSLQSSVGFDNFQFATFIGFSMPVDRTPQVIAHQTALIESGRRRQEVQTLRMRIERETRQALRNRERLLRSLEIANAGVEFAAKEAELATVRYQRGLSNNLDVVNAEENLLAAEARRAVILTTLAVSHLRLRTTMGILDPRNDVK